MLEHACTVNAYDTICDGNIPSLSLDNPDALSDEK